MASAKAIVECPRCGQVRVPISAVTLRNRLDDDSWAYRSRCSKCSVIVLAAMERRTALQAMTAGAPVEYWSLPATAFDDGDGEPIVLDELRTLRLDLDRDDAIEILRASIRSD